MKKNNRKGFTLAELLIVVAIIAVLVAIAIPVFTSQLEKAKEATDASNIRAEYAKVMVDILEDPTTDHPGTDITLTQGVDGWQGNSGDSLDELAVTGDADEGEVTVTVENNPKANGTATFAYTAEDMTLAIEIK